MPLSENVVAKVAVVALMEIGVWVNGPLTLPLAPVKRPVPPVIVVAVVPAEPPEATFVPLPMKSPNSWSPFAAVRVRGPMMKKVLGLVGVGGAASGGLGNGQLGKAFFQRNERTWSVGGAIERLD